MLTEIGIENFKSFGKMQRIPLKPITLLYGPNSSGKSSLIQALLMFKQTLVEGVYKKKSVLLPKGSLVDLKSYSNFINDHIEKKEFRFGLSIILHELFWESSPNFFCWLLGTNTDKVSLVFTFFQDTSGDTRIKEIDVSCGLDTEPIATYKNVWLIPELKRAMKRKEAGENDSGKGMTRGLYDLGKSILILESINLRGKTYKKKWESILDEEEERMQGNESDDDLCISNQLLKDMTALRSSKRLQHDKEEQKKIQTALNILEKLHQAIIDKSYEQLLAIPNLPSFDRIIELSNCFPCRLLTGTEKMFRDIPEFAMIGSLPEVGEGYSRMLPSSLSAIETMACIADTLRNIVYVGPLRAKPERTYEATGEVLENVGVKGEFMADILIGNPDIVNAVNEWFDRFEIGYELKVCNIEMDTYKIVLIDQKTGWEATHKDVGFGISQILPIIVQGIVAVSKGRGWGGIICIEQPEIHLHPRLQAELGDFIIATALHNQGEYTECENQCIIETHSEHIILRLLRRIRETTNGELKEGDIPLRPEDVAVIYAKPTDHGTELMELRISEDGDFIDKWPEGFFTEREKELF